MKDWCLFFLLTGVLLLLISVLFFYFSRGDLHAGKIIGGFFLILSVLCFISFGGLKYKQWVADSHKKENHFATSHTRLFLWPGVFCARLFRALPLEKCYHTN